MKIKIICLFMLVTLLPLCLFGCVKEEKIDYSELEKRTVKFDARFAFDYDTLFFTDSAYYITYSLLSEQDVMLILQADNQHCIKGFKLSVAKENLDENMLPVFKALCYALTLAFAPETVADTLWKSSCIAELKVNYPVTLISGTEKRYGYTLFTDDIGIVYALERT